MDTKAVDVDIEQPDTLDRLTAEQFSEATSQLLDNIDQVIFGKRDVAKDCLIALLSGEHILLEDVPGVGKTLMGKAIAKSVEGAFCRVQFTPDLLPGDILGSSVFNTQTNEFEFKQGPIFNNFILADEINRAPPRTQSALLEAMSDQQVSIDGTTYQLPQPFMVIATQNPFEFEGTYLLPESQMDRFLFRLSMGYPDRSVEQKILNSHRLGEPVDELSASVDRPTLSAVRAAVRRVAVDESISRYIMDVVEATREADQLSVGASTRGALLWYRATQSCALLDGRNYAITDDAKKLAVKVLSHRVRPAGSISALDRVEMEGFVNEIVDSIAVPE